MTIWRRIAEYYAAKEAVADDERFLDALETVLQRARQEFHCPRCPADSAYSVEIYGVNECEVEHHVHAQCRCANCGFEFYLLTHHLLAAAGHALSSYDSIDLHLMAKSAGVMPDPDDDSLG